MPGKVLSLVDRVILPVRILFGGLFIYTSVNHALHATKLLEGIKGYGIVPASLIPVSALLLIAFEAAVGVALVFGYAVRQAAVATAVLLVVFTAAISSAIVRGLDIACACGLGDAQVSWWDVARDVLLIAVALLLAWRCGRENSLAERPASQLSTAK